MAAAESVNSGQASSISSLSSSISTANNAIFYLKPRDGYESLSSYVYPLYGIANGGLSLSSSNSWYNVGYASNHYVLFDWSKDINTLQNSNQACSARVCFFLLIIRSNSTFASACSTVTRCPHREPTTTSDCTTLPTDMSCLFLDDD
jgi:hypothetical protein